MVVECRSILKTQWIGQSAWKKRQYCLFVIVFCNQEKPRRSCCPNWCNQGLSSAFPSGGADHLFFHFGRPNIAHNHWCCARNPKYVMFWTGFESVLVPFAILFLSASAVLPHKKLSCLWKNRKHIEFLEMFNTEDYKVNALLRCILKFYLSFWCVSHQSTNHHLYFWVIWRW